MKLLECPHCKKQAFKLWEIFIFPSGFWLGRKCRHCNKQVRINYNTVYSFVICLIIGIILANVVDKLFSIKSDIVSIAILILFINIPLFLGKRLFLEEVSTETLQDNGSRIES